MSFAAELRSFTAGLRARQSALFEGVDAEIERSIVEGSEITGAPGQPVDTGNLLNSWQRMRLEAFLSRTATNTSYAEANENGYREDHERAAHTRAAHERGAYTREDGTAVSRHAVRAHEVRAHSVTGGPITFRSAVGGAHSVKLTRTGFQRIVEHVLQEIGGAS